jgi:DnaJ family protein C protein 19
MILAALLAVAVLWLTFGGKVLRDRRNWPAIGAMAIGIALLAKGEFIPALVLTAGGAFWLRRPKLGMRRFNPFAKDMELAEARDLLGLPPGADREAIVAAHRRLITRNHPDSGGTQALAARLNAARDLLLRAEPQ